MNDQALQAIWKSYDRRIAEAQLLNAQSWALNLHCFEQLQKQKVSAKLRPLFRFKSAAVLLGLVWVLFLGLLAVGNHFLNPYFTVSVIALGLFSLYALIVYIVQMIRIRRIGFDGTVVDTQKQLAALQASTFRSTRVLWLQMPFYTTWFWNSYWIRHDPNSFWLIAVPVTLLFTALAIWLFKQLIQANMHKKWVNWLIMLGPEYRNLVQSSAFMEELKEFKTELI